MRFFPLWHNIFQPYYLELTWCNDQTKAHEQDACHDIESNDPPGDSDSGHGKGVDSPVTNGVIWPPNTEDTDSAKDQPDEIKKIQGPQEVDGDPSDGGNVLVGNEILTVLIMR